MRSAASRQAIWITVGLLCLAGLSCRGARSDADTLVDAGAPATAEPKQATAAEARSALDEGIAAISARQYRRGLELCEQALRLAGEDRELRAEAYRWLIHGCALEPDPERALAYFEPATALLPDDAWVRYSRGVALGMVGRTGEAIEAFGEALALDPTHIKALQWRAHYHYEALRYAPAIDDCTELLALLEATSDASLAAWGGRRATLVRDTLNIRAGCLDASGQHECAGEDRQRALLIE